MAQESRWGRRLYNIVRIYRLLAKKGINSSAKKDDLHADNRIWQERIVAYVLKVIIRSEHYIFIQNLSGKVIK
jgi:hypothetical protein